MIFKANTKKSFSRRFKRNQSFVTAISFQENTVVLTFANGKEKSINTKDFAYSLLIKRYYHPVRKIQIREKKKRFPFKPKYRTVGTLSISDWKNIKETAVYLLESDLQKTDWKYSNLKYIFFLFIGLFEAIIGDESILTNTIADMDNGNTLNRLKFDKTVSNRLTNKKSV